MISSPPITSFRTHTVRLIAVMLVIVLGSSISNAQGPAAYGPPRGHYTVKVSGQAPCGTPVRTYLGIQLLPDIQFQGRVATVAGTTVSFQGVSSHQVFEDLNRKTYLQVLDGTGEGFISDVDEFNFASLTCAANLTPWLAPGTLVQLRAHSNLSDIFGANNSYGLGAASHAGLADNVVIFDPTSQQEHVYYFNSTRVRWEQKGIEANADRAVMRYPFGLYIVRRTPGTLRIALSGDAAFQSVLLPVISGSNVFSLPINLSASLNEWVSSNGAFPIDKGQNATTADLLTLHEPTISNQRGSYYFSSKLGFEGWRKVGETSSNEANQALDFLSTLILQRDGPAGYVFAKGSLISGPQISLPPDPEPGELPLTGELKFPRGFTPRPNLLYQVETTTDFQIWNLLTVPVNQLGNGNLSFNLPPGQKRAFYRLKVTLNDF